MYESGCDEVSFPVSSGTASSALIPITLEFSSQASVTDCYGSILIDIEDSNNNLCTFTLPYTDPCTRFTVPGGIQSSGDLSFYVAPSLGSGSYRTT